VEHCVGYVKEFIDADVDQAKFSGQKFSATEIFGPGLAITHLLHCKTGPYHDPINNGREFQGCVRPK
jgi:hypothetical protein